MSATRRWPAPWVFSLLILPLGMAVGFILTPLPFLLAKTGVPADRIATMSAIAMSPGVLGLLMAPVVDIKLRRRTWIAIGTFGTAVAACIYFPLIGASHVVLLTALIFAGGMITFLVMAGCGGLMVRVLSSADQSKAAGWTQAGVLGGGALSGAIVLWIAARLSLLLAGLCFAALIAPLGILPFTIAEPAPQPSGWFQGRFATIRKETWDLLRSPERRWGALLLLSPCATGAAQGLLPAIASHYGVGGSGVMWINGIGGGVALALGALCSTLVPGDWDRRLTYAAAGVANALAAILLFAASTPSVYLAGTAFYLVTAGLCAARSVALIVDIVGPEAQDASTLYSLLNAAMSSAIVYVVWLDGLGFRHLGTHGLLAMDAGLNLLVFAVVATVFLSRGIGLRSIPAPAPEVPFSD
jgi:MFS transporter, PAT family, beta-lactamase induction signal transducer AmpG